LCSLLTSWVYISVICNSCNAYCVVTVGKSIYKICHAQKLQH
jgi:hypothetical protein